jgi:hypothetical protein
MTATQYTHHHEGETRVAAPAARVFAWMDDPNHLAGHMNRSSKMMAGGSMCTFLDAGQGRQPGSHIWMRGRMLGFPLELDEIVIVREPPHRKVWETVSEPTLWVLGAYRMGFEVTQQGSECGVSVFIDYNLPMSPWLQPLAWWMNRPYAVWCVDQMLSAVTEEFSHIQA